MSVPRVSHTRPSHARRQRPSHAVEAIPQSLRGDVDAAERWAVDQQVTGVDIIADSVTAEKIKAGTITSREIAAGTITAELLAVGASRPNLLRNGSFEDGATEVLGAYLAPGTTDDETILRGWNVLDAQTQVAFNVDALAKQGTRVGFFKSDAASPRLFQLIPVHAGRTYKLSGWHWKGSAGGVTSRLRANTFNSASVLVTTDVIFHDTTSATPQRVDAYYTVPSDGTVSYLRIELLANGTPGIAEVFGWEDIVLELVPDTLQNSAGTVIIDSSGITILDGSLTIEDEFGSTVATSGGFVGGWADFVRTGLYNGNFSNGTTGTLTLGRNAHLPYWTTTQNVGSPTATGVSGGGASVAFAALNDDYRFRADKVEVTGGQAYYVSLVLEFIRAAGTLVASTDIEWYDSALGLISTSTLDDITAIFSSARAVYNPAPVVAPTNAAYARVRLSCIEQAAHWPTNRIIVYSVSLLHAPPEDLSGRDLQLDNLVATADVTSSSVSTTSVIANSVDTVTTFANVLKLNSTLAPPQFSAQQNNYAPTGLHTASLILLDANGAQNISGLDAGTAGEIKVFAATNGTVTFLHQSASSTAANRFSCRGAANLALSAGGMCIGIYDATTQRWRLSL